MVKKLILCMIALCTYVTVAQQTKKDIFFSIVQGLHRKKDELTRVDSIRFYMVVDSLVKNQRKKLSLDDILQLHTFIYKSINPEYAGKLRKTSVKINGMTPPEADSLPRLMNEFINWMNRTQDHPLKVCAQAHLKFVNIHPFKDGNGRTARTLLAVLLLSNGYPVPTFTVADRKAYSRAIHVALKTGKTDEYYAIIYRGIRRSFENISGKF